ncbi:MAG: alpha/beta fold hydrolase [Ferruginibacter sp.]
MKKFIRRLLRTILVLFILLNVIIMFHAYKFTHFYEAGEITIKPDSLKSGWDKTKEALFGINFAKKKNDVITDTNYHTVILTTKDNLKLEGWYIPVTNAKGTVALFHGHAGNKSGVISEANEFRKMGYNTFLLDFRAHGGSEGNTCTVGNNESEDVKLAYDFIQSKAEKNIILWGISMGAATITKALNDYDLKPSKIILEMPFGSIFQAVKGRIRTMHLPEQPFSTLLTFWGGIEHGFWAFSNKPAMYAKKISCPALLQWGQKDPRVTKEEIDEVYANLPAQKKLVIYESAMHESLCKKENQKWVTEVGSFLNDK